MSACQKPGPKRREFDFSGLHPWGGGQVGADFEEFDEGSQNRGCVGFGVLKILGQFPLPATPALAIF